MKRVAFFTDGWKRLVTYAWNKGIQQEINSYKEKVAIVQYNSFGNWSYEDEFTQAEYNIFNLPDLSEFDGVMLDATNISDDRCVEEIVKKIKDSRLPAVSLGRRIDGLYYIGIDNKSSMKKVLNHLYDIHKCKSYIYAGGFEDNIDNIERETAYREFLKEHNLTVEDNPVWSRDYTFESGVKYFEKMQKECEKFPDAVVCASDNTAMGLIYKAQEWGYNIPEDFLVTGYDNVERAKFFSPHLTTVEQKREDISACGIRTLYNLWDGKKLPNEILVDQKIELSQSCGCLSGDNADYGKFVDELMAKDEHRGELEDELAMFQVKISSVKSFEEIFNATEEYLTSRMCDGFVLALDRRVLAIEPLDDVPKKGYSSTDIMVPVGILDNERLEFQGRKDFLKYLLQIDKSTEYMISPLHFHEIPIGFLLIENGGFLEDNPYYCNFLMFLTQAIHRVYQSFILERDNKQLERLSMHDLLTGAFNRMAFMKMAKIYIEKCHKNNKHCVICFVDADKFKEINDTYGHDKGDQVLIYLVKTLEKQAPEGNTVFRFGGDEFVVLFSAEDESDLENFKKRISDELGQHQISVSIGAVWAKNGDEMDIESYLKEADAKMYEIKKRKHER